MAAWAPVRAHRRSGGIRDYLLAIEQLEERRLALEAKLTDLSQRDPYREPVAWLRCFRGVDTMTAITLIAELHDFRRFRSARELMAGVGTERILER